MKKFPALVLVCLTAFPASTTLASYVFTTIDDPLASPGSTFAQGIYENTIVGYYRAGNVTHGFIDKSGSFTTFDIPGGKNTQLLGISGDSLIGEYLDTNNQPQSFLYQNGIVTIIALPSARGTIQVTGISGNTVVGYDGSNPFGMNAFSFTNGIYSTFSAPYTTPGNSTLQGIDGDSMVGLYNDLSGGPFKAFSLIGGTFSTLSDPAATQGTTPFGISGNNVVGTYGDAKGSHAFIETNGTYVNLDVPDAAPGQTLAQGIYGNSIVGWYTNTSNFHGFLATQVPEPASLAFFLSSSLFLLKRKNKRSLRLSRLLSQ